MLRLADGPVAPAASGAVFAAGVATLLVARSGQQREAGRDAADGPRRGVERLAPELVRTDAHARASTSLT